jgi:hypothetical protein
MKIDGTIKYTQSRHVLQDSERRQTNQNTEN